VRVSGDLFLDGRRISGTLRVRGTVAGRLRLRSTSSASGVLDGVRVSLSGAAAAREARAGAGAGVPAALLRPGAAERALSARGAR
jgi:hypothetical protein